VTWVDCATRPPPGGAPTSCDRPLRSDELVIRVMAANDPAEGRSVGLGMSVINRATGTGFLSTVYADRVLALTRRSGTSARLLLGRTIAHEIGHLLLGTNRHADTGLMRASWSQTDLQRDRSDDWRFLGHQASAMQQTVALRLATTVAQRAY
jgi:hypothetical protein